MQSRHALGVTSLQSAVGKGGTYFLKNQPVQGYWSEKKKCVLFFFLTETSYIEVWKHSHRFVSIQLVLYICLRHFIHVQAI